MRLHRSELGASGPEDIGELLEAADAFERELNLDTGTIIRGLVDLLKKQHRFETLRKQFDHRGRGRAIDG